MFLVFLLYLHVRKVKELTIQSLNTEKKDVFLTVHHELTIY